MLVKLIRILQMHNIPAIIIQREREREDGYHKRALVIRQRLCDRHASHNAERIFDKTI